MKRMNDRQFAGKIAYSYARVSGETQEEGTSLEEQLKENKACAKKLGMKIGKEYAECGSAMKLGKRREFESLIEEIRDKEHSFLICYDPTRLSRNGGDMQVVRELIDEKRLTLIFSRNSEIFQYPLLPDQSVMLGMKCEFANYEIRVSNQKCRAGILAKSVAGFRPCNTPIGYKNDKKNNLAVIVDKDSKLVKKAFMLASTGKFSFQEISDTLCAKGFVYPHPSGKIPISTLEHILRNPFYAGIYRVKQTGEFVKGNHKAIVSQALFDKVQEMIGGNSPFREKKQFLYSKLIVCDSCGHFLIGDEKRKPNGNRYVYFRCLNKACKSKPHPNESKIDDKIQSCLKEIRLNLIPSELVEKETRIMLSEKRQKIGVLRHSASQIFSKMEKFRENVSENDISDAEYISEMLSKMQKERESCLSQANALSKQVEQFVQLSSETMQKRLFDVFARCDDKRKRQILELIANRYNFADGKLKISLVSEIRKIRSRNKQR